MFVEFIEELRKKNISIKFSNGKLQYSGPEENIDQELLINLKRYKSKLLKHFWPKECINMMPVNTEGSKIPLSILHAGNSNYAISELLGNDQPFYGFFYIGSEGEQIRYKSVEEFAQVYLQQLRFIIPNGPYLLGGYSIGGNLAFDMAVKLQKEGFEVPLLVLTDSGLPAYNKNKMPAKLSKKLYFVSSAIYHFFLNILLFVYYKLVRLLFKKVPVKRRKKYILWTYYELLKKYKPTEKFKGDILLFRAEQNDSKYNYLGWEKVCDNIKLITFPGDHNRMYDDKETINRVSGEISKWVQEHSSRLKV